MFSVVIPVHNKVEYLERSVKSVLNQTFKSFELILIDDASSDGSETLLYEFDDPRIRIFKRDIPGAGGYAARNLGINEAKFDWIAFLDADDKWEPHHLEDLSKAYLKYKDVEIISTKWVKHQKNKIIEVREFNKYKDFFINYTMIDFLYTKSLMWTGAVCIKTSLLRAVSGFPEQKCKRGGDMDTWIRCLWESKCNIFVNRVSVTYFLDIENQVTDNKKNPPVKICAEQTINDIRLNTSDMKLLKAIDVYCASFAFNLSIKSIERGSGLSYDTINMIESPIIKFKVYLKLYVFIALKALGLK